MEASTMMKLSMVKSPSKTLLEDIFSDFEKKIASISSKLMRKMGYDGPGIGKEGEGILIPIVAK